MSTAPPAEFREYNFDGLVGPTHHYGGLSHGNPASMQNRSLVAHPRLAVRQGLAKMRCLFELGVGQALIPPCIARSSKCFAESDSPAAISR